MTARETAIQIVDKILATPRHEDFVGIVEAALLEERERCAKVVETADLMGWVKDGGQLREVIASMIRSGEETK